MSKRTRRGEAQKEAGRRQALAQMQPSASATYERKLKEQIVTIQNEAVELGHAEYYFDENNDRRWRWKKCDDPNTTSSD